MFVWGHFLSCVALSCVGFAEMDSICCVVPGIIVAGAWPLYAARKECP